MQKEDGQFMELALEEAELAFREDEVPVGAVVVMSGKVVGRGRNRRERLRLVTSHAEIEAIQKASRTLGTWRLENCDIYVTLEPCPMCAGAIIQARIKRLVFGAYDPKGGAAGGVVDLLGQKLFNHRVDVIGGILEERCSQTLKKYFTIKRNAEKRRGG